jgi:hypothetical protein
MTMNLPKLRRRKRWLYPPSRNEAVRARPLTFSPLAWLKLQFYCHAGNTEVGGFGLSHADDLLYVEDVIIVRQRCSFATVRFEDAAVADLCDDMADAGIEPQRYLRLWIHTHPGVSVEPSDVDETTFTRVFGDCDWAVMAILGRTGRLSARLRFNVGPVASIELSTKVDWSAWPHVLDARPPLSEQIENWHREYTERVIPDPIIDVAETQFRSEGFPLGDNLFSPISPGKQP